MIDVTNTIYFHRREYLRCNYEILHSTIIDI